MDFFLRERDSYPQEKKELDDKLNDALKNCKRHGYVTNLMFQKIHENVGIIANDESNVIEPILPTNYHIAYQSVEANRKEVNILLSFFLCFN